MATVRAGIRQYKQTIKELESLQDKSRIVLKRVMADVRDRVPGWVATEVTKVYGIKKAEITPGKKGTGKKLAGQIQLRGETVDTAQIVYTGRLLTPTHFGITPKSPPDGKGYTLKAEILKGSKATMGKVKKLSKKQRAALAKNFTRSGSHSSPSSPIMLLPNKGGGYIPFQRVSQRRNDLEAIKTISVPQMVSSDRTRDQIREAINEGLEKRLENHMKLLRK